MLNQQHISLTKNATPSMVEFETIAKSVFQTVQDQLLEVYTKENLGRKGLMYIDLNCPINTMKIGDDIAIKFCYTAGNFNSQIFRRIPAALRSAVISSSASENYMCAVVEGWGGMFSMLMLRIK